MLKNHSIPTPLLGAAERPPIETTAPQPPSRARFLEVGLFLLCACGHWLRVSLLQSLTIPWNPEETARGVRGALERLGGLWIKTGQLLAMRRDLFPDEFCDELANLQDRSHGFPPAIARGILEEDLGGPLPRHFSEFEDAPMAVGSVGQVHVGRLRHNGMRVAIKIQRPHVVRRFRLDLSYLRFLVKVLLFFEILPNGRWREFLWELERTLLEEVDYRLEASSISRMRRLLRRHRVYGPKVFPRFCSPRVLVMEFVQGVFMSEYIKVATSDPERLQAWLTENDIEPAKVGRRIYFSHLRQMFEDGLFHCDLHPGNIVLLRESRVALIDFGSLGSFEVGKLTKYHLMFRAIAERDYSKAADVFLMMGPSLPSVDIEEVRSEIVRSLRQWETRTPVKALPYHQKSMTRAIGDIAKVLTRHRVPATWEFMRAHRAELTLDASLMYLMPQLDYRKLARRYEFESRMRALRRLTKPLAIADRLGRTAVGLDLMVNPLENAYFDGDWLRRRAINFQARITKAMYLLEATFAFIARAGLVVLATLLLAQARRFYPRFFRATDQSWLGPALDRAPQLPTELWLGILVVTLYVFRVLSRVRQRIAEKDVIPSPWS